MSNNNSNLTSRHLRSIATVATLLGLGTIVSGAYAVVGTQGIMQTDATPLILAQTEGMDRRQDRRGDRQDDRGDRRDTRQDCRSEEGVVGKDKRDCKQEGREERREDDKG